MSFIIDKQTISDLELFSTDEGSFSLFDHYNRTQTIGGQEYLYKLISNPILDGEYIENRKREIHFFARVTPFLKLNKRQIDFIEYYLRNRRIPLRGNIIDAIKDRLLSTIKPDNDYYVISQGILSTLHLLKDFRDFLEELPTSNVPNSIKKELNSAVEFISKDNLISYIDKLPIRSNQLKPYTINKLDYLFRIKYLHDFKKLLNLIYHIDAFQSVSSLIKNDKYTLSEIVLSEDPILEVTDCYHPFLKNPIKNSFSFNSKNNFCFLTGPNMSGKSTFLKTIAFLVYFSHLGLPVPAERIKISLFQCLFTTINLSDNLTRGLSHFYGEVKRVKEMTNEIKSNKNIVVVLDELFRGTNVKDAYEATKLIINKLSKIKGCLFFISSHILEVAEDISESNHIDFRCFELSINNGVLTYDFKLKKGISSERIGLQIIYKENIEVILDDIIKQQNEQKLS